MTTDSEDNAGAMASTGSSRWSLAFWLAWLTVTVLVAWNEWPRWRMSADAGAVGWMSDPHVDWTPFLPVLLLAIPLWLIRHPLLDRPLWWWSLGSQWFEESCPTLECAISAAAHVRALVLSGIVAATGFLMGSYVGHQFGDLPPAYHDEYSYLFQAQTFLEKRMSFPSFAPMPELFDQMHVLNEGRFASRYFPGAGVWIALFLWMGNAWWGHWLAHAIASFLVFWIGRHLSNNRVGLLAGMLMAVSPGVALFSNLLLAHHPTLVGLLIFVITFLKLRRSLQCGKPARGWALLAGAGLTYAMLCRPMTAAGVGLPFGVWFGWWLLTGRATPHRLGIPGQWTVPVQTRLQVALAMVLPLTCGFTLLCGFNRAITGDPFVTPYQRYTDIYTPRHVYGFNNRVRGETALGPKVLDHYDTWAENLTPVLAAKNVWRRTLFSMRWILGIVPLLLTGIVFLLTIHRWSSDWWLMGAAIVSLHAVHIPYWFEGIMGWHYVFESAPFWLLLFAGVLDRLQRNWKATGHPWMPLWGLTFVAVCVLVNLVTIVPLWPARIDIGIAEVGFARRRYAAFNQTVEQFTGDRPSLVLVQADPSDRHMDYVVNDPGLRNRILFGRFRPNVTDAAEVAKLFPDRDLWTVNVATGEITLLSRSTP